MSRSAVTPSGGTRAAARRLARPLPARRGVRYSSAAPETTAPTVASSPSATLTPSGSGGS